MAKVETFAYGRSVREQRRRRRNNQQLATLSCNRKSPKLFHSSLFLFSLLSTGVWVPFQGEGALFRPSQNFPAHIFLSQTQRWKSSTLPLRPSTSTIFSSPSLCLLPIVPCPKSPIRLVRPISIDAPIRCRSTLPTTAQQTVGRFSFSRQPRSRTTRKPTFRSSTSTHDFNQIVNRFPAPFAFAF